MAGSSEGTKKGNLKKVEKHGTDYFKRIGAIGGSKRKRGYFGRLKDEGRLDELKSLASQAGKKSNEIRGKGKGSRSQKETKPVDEKELW